MLKKLTVLLVLLLFACSLHAKDYDSYIGGHLMLVNAMDAEKGYCLDLEGFAIHTNLEAPLIAHACKAGLWKDGTWKVDYPHTGNIYLPAFDLCATAKGLADNAELMVEACSDAPLQRFLFRDDGKVQVNAESDQAYCLGVGLERFPSGSGVRRQARILNCDETDEKYTTWIVPREDTVYPPIQYSVEEAKTIPTRPPASNNGTNTTHPFVRSCGGCHGEQGEGYQSEHSPKLTGLSKWYLTRQMLAFQNDYRGNHTGERWAKQMNYHVQALTKKEIDSFVKHTLTLDDTAAPVTITGDIERGKTLYTDGCKTCHRADGNGSRLLKSPRLTGMSDWYMVKQLQNYRAGLRGDHPDDKIGLLMVPSAKALPDEQALLDVVAYINTLSGQ